MHLGCETDEKIDVKERQVKAWSRERSCDQSWPSVCFQMPEPNIHLVTVGKPHLHSCFLDNQSMDNEIEREENKDKD